MNWLRTLFGKHKAAAEDAPSARQEGTLPPEALLSQAPSEPASPAVAPASPSKRPRIVQLSTEEMALFERHGQNPGRLLEAARTDLKEGRYDDAYHEFLILTKITPEQVMPWRACGIALYSKDEAVWKKQSGDLPSANAELSLKYFDKALALERNDHATWYYRGFALAQIGYITDDKKRLKEGLDAFDEALRTRPGDASTLKAKAQFEKTYLALGGVLPRTESGARFKERARQRAREWWQKQSRTSGVCDICNGSVSSSDSYLLDSEDILRSEAYFEQVAHSPMAAMWGMSPQEAKAAQRAQVMADQTPWMVCPKCIGLFE
jgi:tetratricopeptide (TPR) repeat protein